MVDLIDRDELMRKHTTSPNHDNRHNTVEELKCLLDLIHNAHTIDAVPVIHGHWNFGKCSKCNSHAPYWCMSSGYYKSNYCPSCGAKMDETLEQIKSDKGLGEIKIHENESGISYE